MDNLCMIVIIPSRPPSPPFVKMSRRSSSVPAGRGRLNDAQLADGRSWRNRDGTQRMDGFARDVMSATASMHWRRDRAVVNEKPSFGKPSEAWRSGRIG